MVAVNAVRTPDREPLALQEVTKADFHTKTKPAPKFSASCL